LLCQHCAPAILHGTPDIHSSNHKYPASHTTHHDKIYYTQVQQLFLSFYFPKSALRNKNESKTYRMVT
jgi:hypothetical protein